MKKTSTRLYGIRTIFPNFCALIRLIIIISMVPFCSPGCNIIREQKEIMIIRNARSKYRIVIAKNASPSTIHGATELQMFLYQMTGAELPIVTDSLPLTKHEIIIGNNSHLKQIGLNIDFEMLGDAGYALKTVGSYIIIAGGNLRGNMYGVYGLLEDHLGCKWFTPEVSHVPRYNRLAVPVLDEFKIPKFEYREPYVREAFDGDWASRNRMNRNSKYGGT